jgi:hypothetical protein
LLNYTPDEDGFLSLRYNPPHEEIWMTLKKSRLVFISLVVFVPAVCFTSCRSGNRGMTLEVPAKKMWFDTGLDVTNKTVQIKYESGTWSNDGVDQHFCDGEGFIPEAQDFRDVIPKLLVTNAPLGALVGKTSGEPFFVGNSYEGRPGAGHLFLSINDKPDSFDDNSGSVRIVVTPVD